MLPQQIFPGRASHVNTVSRLVDLDAALRAICADISRMGEAKKRKKKRDKQGGPEKDKNKRTYKACKRGMWDHVDVNVKHNKTGKEMEERDERRRSFMSADMLCVEKKRADSHFSVQLHQEPPGNPAEPVNAVLR